MVINNKVTLILLLSIIFLFLNHPVLSDTDEEDILFTGINSYRTSQNLTTLIKNENAECLADEIAEEFKNRPCTNATGSATVPGTEPQFADYPKILTKCHLNVSDTRDGSIMPACVPRLESSLVLTNFTKSQYSKSLNDSKFAGMGIGKENHWIVVVLTTNTPGGSYATDTDSKDHDDDHDDDSSGFTFCIGLVNYLLALLMSFCFFLWKIQDIRAKAQNKKENINSGRGPFDELTKTLCYVSPTFGEEKIRERKGTLNTFAPKDDESETCRCAGTSKLEIRGISPQLLVPYRKRV